MSAYCQIHATPFTAEPPSDRRILPSEKKTEIPQRVHPDSSEPRFSSPSEAPKHEPGSKPSQSLTCIQHVRSQRCGDSLHANRKAAYITSASGSGSGAIQAASVGRTPDQRGSLEGCDHATHWGTWRRQERDTGTERLSEN